MIDELCEGEPAAEWWAGQGQGRVGLNAQERLWGKPSSNNLGKCRHGKHAHKQITTLAKTQSPKAGKDAGCRAGNSEPDATLLLEWDSHSGTPASSVMV